MKRAQDNLSPLFIVLSLCCDSTENPSVACPSWLEFYTNVLQVVVFGTPSCRIDQLKTRIARKPYSRIWRRCVYRNT